MAQGIARHVSIVFQVGVFVATLPLWFVFLYKPICKFNTHDTQPELIQYSLEQKQLLAEHIKTGLYIHSFTKVDLLHNDDIFEGIIWFAFDESKTTLQDIEQFSIENGAILYKSAPSVSKHTGYTFVQFNIKARIHTHFNYRAYPLDDHALHIVIGNEILAGKASFEVDTTSFILDKEVQIPNYTIEQLHAKSGYSESVIRRLHETTTVMYPRAVYTIDCNRIDIRHFVNIFMPLLLIFFFTMFAFSFDFDEHGPTVLSLAAAGVPALLAYRFVIESVSPDVHYFMLSDYLFFLFLALVLAIFVFVAGAIRATEQVKKSIIVSLYAGMFVGCITIFYWIL